ncbi:MAG: 30S ribosomal protein S3 [Candidatus Omnitrophica bacterium]|nr:30S ribosomal protein S3 [Candidatus Omnitrophota bacterium]
MGQKVHPHGFRLGYIRNWDSIWFAKKSKDIACFIEEDNLIRKHIKKSLAQAAVAKVEIMRASNKIKVNIWSARPGLIIGRRGSEIDRLRDELQEKTGKQMFIDIKEIKSAATEASLIAENIAFQLEKRIPFRRTIKKAATLAMAQGVGGIKILIAGRLGGAEIARSEKIQVGKVPLQTLRADIEYGFSEAHTTYGLIGVKVWVYKGEKPALYSKERREMDEKLATETSRKKPKFYDASKNSKGAQKKRVSQESSTGANDGAAKPVTDKKDDSGSVQSSD